MTKPISYKEKIISRDLNDFINGDDKEEDDDDVEA